MAAPSGTGPAGAGAPRPVQSTVVRADLAAGTRARVAPHGEMGANGGTPDSAVSREGQLAVTGTTELPALAVPATMRAMPTIHFELDHDTAVVAALNVIPELAAHPHSELYSVSWPQKPL